MPDLTRTPIRFWLPALATGFVLILTASTATAAPLFGVFSQVDEANTNLFEWSAPFSLWRWVVFVVGVMLSWFTAFNVLMLSSLALDNPKPPRPREALGRALGWFILFTSLSFVTVFAVVANDLYRKPWVKWFPSVLMPLNYHILWIGALILGLVLMFVFRYLFRRPA
ncbi:MAG: hypothetical protein K8U57_20210 [Planctomycetes bacterium]|nr:hypothetical protein [Planctomycetota bacterium]